MRTEPFTRLLRHETADGLGGLVVTWEEGETLALVCVPEEPRMARPEARPEVTRRSLLFGEADLRPGERLRRQRDGAVLRVCGDAGHFRPPARALNRLGQTEAEVLTP